MSEANAIRANGLTGTLSARAQLNGTIGVGSLMIGEYPRYEGEYVVTPMPEEAQILPTAKRALEADITVKKIPFYEMPNMSGGETAYIGSEV